MKEEEEEERWWCCPCCNEMLQVYASHFLSSWGDRMWMFAGGLFLLEVRLSCLDSLPEHAKFPWFLFFYLFMSLPLVLTYAC